MTAFGLTLLAGLATGVGSAIALFSKKTNFKFLSASLGFSAGVMIYVSFVEIFVKSKTSLCIVYGDKTGYLLTVLSFFSGMLIAAAIDKIVPSFENPHEMRKIEDMSDTSLKKNAGLLRMGIFSAIAIAIHNFPEGLATFAAALKDTKIGISIAAAIAIHNIPEGIAVSVPIFYSTGSKKKAFFYSFLSGLAEPVGALIGYLLLFSFFNDAVFGFLFGSVAGIMVFISLDELLPASREYGEHHYSIYGLFLGMLIMAFSLILFA